MDTMNVPTQWTVEHTNYLTEVDAALNESCPSAYISIYNGVADSRVDVPPQLPRPPPKWAGTYHRQWYDIQGRVAQDTTRSGIYFKNGKRIQIK